MLKRYGKQFKFFKLPTMAIDSERIGEPSPADDEPRITRVRKLSGNASRMNRHSLLMN